MKSGRRAFIQLLLALVAAAGCVMSWRASISTVGVPPILDNEPWTTSLIYSPPLLTLSFLLATVAGVLAVLGVARLWRRAQNGAGSSRGAWGAVETIDTSEIY